MKTSCMTADLNKHCDGALVVAAKCGDTQAFEELVARHERRALAVAQRITKNREDAEEVVQDTFHKVFIHLGRFQEKSQFSTWLTRIAMNEAFMLLRRRRGALEVLPESPDDGETLVAEVFVDQHPNPEESCWQRERSNLLTRAINQLSPKTRTTILLRGIEECSLGETAEILGTSLGVVKSRFFQGRRKLRRTLNPRLLRGVHVPGRERAQGY
jgi:RNA polymerase sigma-70 factor (ECF subfamily)